MFELILKKIGQNVFLCNFNSIFTFRWFYQNIFQLANQINNIEIIIREVHAKFMRVYFNFYVTEMINIVFNKTISQPN